MCVAGIWMYEGTSAIGLMLVIDTITLILTYSKLNVILLEITNENLLSHFTVW